MIVYFETNSEHTVPLEVQITFVSKNVRNVVLYGWIILVALWVYENRKKLLEIDYGTLKRSNRSRYDELYILGMGWLSLR